MNETDRFSQRPNKRFRRSTLAWAIRYALHKGYSWPASVYARIAARNAFAFNATVRHEPRASDGMGAGLCASVASPDKLDPARIPD